VKNEPKAALPAVVKEEKPVSEKAVTAQVVNKVPETKQETNEISNSNNTLAKKQGDQQNNTTGSKPLTAGSETKTSNSNPVAATQKPVVEEEPRVLEDLGNTVITRNPPARTTPANTQARTEKSGPATTVNETKKPEPEVKKEIATVQPTVTPKKLETQSTSLPKSLSSSPAAAYVAERITEAPQYVNYVSDSLVLILYDNGEVDGDTVSVLLNGSMFMEKQGLKTAAIKKTIHITPGNEELTLILYAENLGRYPPNTGLLVIYDGEDRHQLRFSADLKKNASVVFRRKK
jgi:hypothetical protein